MSVERSGQGIEVETSKGQLVTGGARGFDEGRQLFIDGTSRQKWVTEGWDAPERTLWLRREGEEEGVGAAPSGMSPESCV